MNLSAYLAQQAKIKANEDSNYMATMKDMRAEQDNTDHNWLINPGHYSSNQSASRNIQIDTVLDKIVIHVDQLSDSYAQIHEQVSKALKDLISNFSTSSSTVQTRGIGGNDKNPGPERQPVQNISFNVTPNQLPVDKTRYSIQPNLPLDLPYHGTKLPSGQQSGGTAPTNPSKQPKIGTTSPGSNAGPQTGAIGHVPPTIKQIIAEGKKSSATFASLLSAAKITNTNYSQFISYGGGDTHTDINSGKISLTPNGNIKYQVIKLTHELTNEKNLEELKKLNDKVKQGKITPEEYANQLMLSEVPGEINQVKVAAEIGFRFNGKEKEAVNKVIDAYSKDKTMDLKKVVAPNPSAIQDYVNQGKQLRKDYLNNHPATNDKNDKTKKN